MANPYQQARENLRGERRPHGGHPNDIRPPNLYYDYGNSRQTFQPPSGIQIANGYIPLNSRPSGPHANKNRMLVSSNEPGPSNSQGVRFMSAPEEFQHNKPFITNPTAGDGGIQWPSNANVITHELRGTEATVGLEATAMAVMRRAMRESQQVRKEGIGQSKCSSEEPPNLSKLERVARAARRAVRSLGNRVEDGQGELEELVTHGSESSVRGEWKGPRIPREEPAMESKENGGKGEAYDLWVDLNSLKVDITFGQLLEISPIARNTLKEGMPVARRRRRAKTQVAARVQ